MASKVKSPPKRGGPLRYAGSKKPSKNKPPKGGKTKDEKGIVRGKEVSVRSSADEAQILYGRMKMGGNITFIETSQEASAYLVTGDEASNNQLVFTFRTAGGAGNSEQVLIECAGANTATTVANMLPSLLKITLRTDGANASLATLNEVISAVQANGTAWSYYNVQKLVSGVNGIVQPVAQTNLSYGGGNWLHQIVTLTGHEVDEIEELYLDGEEVAFGATPDARWGTGKWSNRVFMAKIYGSDSQEAQADLAAQLPTRWTSNHRQRGWSGIYLITVWDANLFAEGLPKIQVYMRGKKCYDPRTGVTAFSNNGALVIGDFLMNTKYGFGIPQSRIHLATWQAAADACQVPITKADGGLEERYLIDGLFDVGSPEEILKQLEQAIAGQVVETNGIYYILPGVWRTPSLTFDEDDLRGEVTYDSHVSLSDTFNCVRGTYVSPEADWNETDFPAVKNSTYITEDGKELWMDLALNFVTQNCQAQRIAKIALEKVRQGGTLVWPGKLSCYNAIVGDTVYINYARLGFVNKTFEVEQVDLVVEGDGSMGCDLILRETAEAIYDWNAGMETQVDIAPNTTLPDPRDVEPPTDLVLTTGTPELYIRNDGTIAPRIKVSWTPSTTIYVTSGGFVQVQFKPSSSSDWSPSFDVLSGINFQYLADVQSGVNYDVRIRALNTLGYPSDWVQELNFGCIGKEAKPSDVTNFVAVKNDFGIAFSWDAIADLDKDEYEIRVGASWAAGTYVWRGKGTTARWEHKAAGTYNFWIKAYDTSSIESLNALEEVLTITLPSTPSVTSTLNGPNLILTWTASTADFAIREYEIRYGADYASGSVVGVSTTNNHTLRVDWGGARSFFVAARDISGNTGAAGSVVVTIENPNPAQSFAVRAVANNILLDWKAPVASTLPIAEYHIYKGETYISSILLGVVYGTFHTYVEQLGGTFGYHVLAVDTAGNFSSVVSFTTTITVPDNFYIKSQLELVNSGDVAIINESLWNAVRVEIVPGQPQEQIFFPTASTSPGASLPWITHFVEGGGVEETWEEWWDNNGWTTWQDAVDYDDLVFPTPTNTGPGHIEWTVDYTVTFSESFIDFLYNVEALGEGANITPSLSISADGVTYTTYSGATQLFAENFRFVKYRIDFQALDNKSLLRLSEATARISLSLDEETQDIQCFAADHASDGTLGYFIKDYLDVEDIQATPTGLVFGVAVVNFDDDPNPESFRVLLFNAEGDPIDGWVNIRIRGAVNP